MLNLSVVTSSNKLPEQSRTYQRERKKDCGRLTGLRRLSNDFLGYNDILKRLKTTIVQLNWLCQSDKPILRWKRNKRIALQVLGSFAYSSNSRFKLEVPMDV